MQAKTADYTCRGRLVAFVGLPGSVDVKERILFSSRLHHHSISNRQMQRSRAGGNRMDADLSELITVAHRVADTAAVVARKYFRTKVEVDVKSDASPVTIADREAEKVMREVISAAVPNHCIFGEEQGFQAGREDSPYLWVIDPIDGTKSFITGTMFSIWICVTYISLTDILWVVFLCDIVSSIFVAPSSLQGNLSLVLLLRFCIMESRF